MSVRSGWPGSRTRRRTSAPSDERVVDDDPRAASRSRPAPASAARAANRNERDDRHGRRSAVHAAGLVAGREVVAVEQRASPARAATSHEPRRRRGDGRIRLHARAARRSRERPGRVLAEQLVVAVGVALDERRAARPRRRCSRRDERVPAQPARVVARHVEAVVALDELGAVRLEPLDERDVRLRVRPAARLAARRFSTPRFQGQTSWQMSQP